MKLPLRRWPVHAIILLIALMPLQGAAAAAPPDPGETAANRARAVYVPIVANRSSLIPAVIPQAPKCLIRRPPST